MITVFKSGILDLSIFLFMIILSLTSQGDISSRLVSPWRLLELLLMMLELWPFARFSELNLLFSVFLLFRILVFDKLDAENREIHWSFMLFKNERGLNKLRGTESKWRSFIFLLPRTGRRLLDIPGLVPTLERDLVTGWLLANVVS